jgi:hypothetical protein
MYQVLHGQEQQTPNGVVVHLIDDDGHPVTVEVFGNDVVWDVWKDREADARNSRF